MEETLISLETAKLAKKCKFNVPCKKYYLEGVLIDEWGALISNDALLKDDNYSAPTQALLAKWLRDLYHLHITIFSQSQKSWQFHITEPHQSLEETKLYEDYGSYEEALEDALKESLVIIIKENRIK